MHQLYIPLTCLFGFLMACGVGANDVSNAMGTSVGSKAITLRQAMIIAMIFEFAGAFLAGGEVTHTLQRDLVDLQGVLDARVAIWGMMASLLAGATWLITASALGWPVSTTHTMVGAIVGFSAVELGLSHVHWYAIARIALSWVLSPVVGLSVAYFLFWTVQRWILDTERPLECARRYVPYYMFLTGLVVSVAGLHGIQHLGVVLVWWQKIGLSVGFAAGLALIGRATLYRLALDPAADREFEYTNVERLFRVLMLFTACSMAFAHGSNDAANAVGPVAAVVQLLDPRVGSGVPGWILFLGASGIVTGLLVYGYRVIATVGAGITDLTPSRGFCAELAAASTVLLASAAGMPVSTTHILVGAILGVGLARGINALNRNTINRIFLSWLITIPVGAGLSVLFYEIFQIFE